MFLFGCEHSTFRIWLHLLICFGDERCQSFEIFSFDFIFKSQKKNVGLKLCLLSL